MTPKPRLAALAFRLSRFVLFLALPAAHAADPSATLTGFVSNTATGNLLEGARVEQQFTFLPGLLKGLSASANYTIIDTRGNFGGPTLTFGVNGRF